MAPQRVLFHSFAFREYGMQMRYIMLSNIFLGVASFFVLTGIRYESGPRTPRHMGAVGYFVARVRRE